MPQLAAFLPWAVLGWTAVLVVLLAGRRWVPALVVALVVLVQLPWILPARGAAAATAERPGAVTLRVMTVNVLVGGADVSAVLKEVTEDRVDLLAVQEGLPGLVERLDKELADTLPHVLRSDPAEAAGTVVWSRWPLSRLGSSFGEGSQIFRSELRVSGAVPVTLTAVHTMSPGRGRIGGWTRDLVAVANASRSTSGAQILLGDFNATRDHAPFRALLDTGLVDAAEAVGTPPWRGATWPADRVLPLVGRLPSAVRLDHVLVTPATVAVRGVRPVLVPRTDHRGLRVDLELAPY